MKINFLTLNKNENTASYRIWVKDLNDTLVELGYESKIKTRLNEIDKDVQVLILCKSAYKYSKQYRDIVGKSVKIGAINIDRSYFCKDLDFVIVGSPEEYSSISKYRNVFIHPLVERKFKNTTRKVHKNDDHRLKLCFHGNYPHLFKFHPFLKDAIEYYDKNIKKVNLKVITGNKDFDWKVGRPDVEIEMLNYDDNISSYIKSCDIGLVPNLTDGRLYRKDTETLTSVEFGLYDSDYLLRYKNKTNAGRAYVFYQHGIPVIHDLSPSSFELMKLTGYNVCAHDSESWLRELKYLSNIDTREAVSKSYYQAFKDHYDTHEIAKELIQKIRKINE